MKTSIIVALLLLSINAIAQSNSWVQRANFPGGYRRFPFSFVIGNKAYVGCGEDSTGTFRSDFWEYNSQTDQWTQKADFGGGVRYQPLGFSINGKGYAGFGLQYFPNTYFGDIWEYDPATDIWAQKSSIPPGWERRGAVSFVINNVAYIGTGTYNAYCLNDFWQYNPDSNTWSFVNYLPTSGRFGAVGFSIANKGYLATGQCWGDFFNDVWEFDPSTTQWTPKSNFPDAARYSATGFTIGQKGYVGTGMGGSGWTNDLWEYSPITEEWVQKASVPTTGRYEAVSFSISNRAYAGLGYKDDQDDYRFFNDLWEYQPDSATAVLSKATNASFQATLYPNPTAGEITVVTNGHYGLLVITDVLGRKVESLTVPEHKALVAISDLPAGVLSYNLTEPTGKTFTGKLIVIKP